MATETVSKTAAMFPAGSGRAEWSRCDEPGGSDIRVRGVPVPGLTVNGLVVTGIAFCRRSKVPLPFVLERVDSEEATS